MTSTQKKTFINHIGDFDAKKLLKTTLVTSTLKTFKHHIGELRTREWWTPRIKKTSQQEILKRKKNQQKHPKLETDDFPRGTKKKTKKKTTTRKKNLAKHREKFSNVPAELTSRTMQNGRKYQTTWNFFSQQNSYHIFQHFFTSQLAK